MGRRGRKKAGPRGKKRVRGPTTTINKPICVFVSSSQREFTSLRNNLKRQLQLEKIGRKHVFEGILVEKKLGERIRSDIREGLDNASIFVILLGKEKSLTTLAEFDDAWLRGIPILIYEYGKLGKKNGMSRFRAKLRKLGIRAQVPEIPYETDQDVIDHVINDLAEKFGELANKYVAVRNTVSRKGLYSEPGR